MSCGHELRHRAPTCHVCLDERTKERDDAMKIAKESAFTFTNALLDMKKERDEARAECAAMRKSVANAKGLIAHGHVQQAMGCLDLSEWGECGRDLLERLAKLERVAEAAREWVHGLRGTSVDHALRALDEVKL